MDVASRLSIHKLAEPVLSPPSPIPAHLIGSRASNASVPDKQNVPTPTGLHAELEQHKDLFRKLRFAYVSQVTKERFLRSILSSPPHFATAAENAQLEASVVELKSSLQTDKATVAAQLMEIEATARDLARKSQRHDALKQQMEQLPSQIEQLEDDIRQFRLELGHDATAGEAGLPLSSTMEVVRSRQLDLEALEREISVAEKDAQAKHARLERLESELQPLEEQKVKITRSVHEMQQRREQGNTNLAIDEIEAEGKWMQGALAVLGSLLRSNG